VTTILSKGGESMPLRFKRSPNPGCVQISQRREADSLYWSYERAEILDALGVETNPIGDIADLIASQRTQIAERDRTINAQSSNIRTYQRKIQELREAESGFLARKQDMDQEMFLLRQERDEAVRTLDVFRTEAQVAKTALQRLGLI